MDNTDTTRQAIILGALLHDIGKFVQRAGEKLDEKGRRDAETFCPKPKGFPTHLHVIFSERYIQDYLPKKWEKAGNFALRHHQPDAYEDKIIQLADWLSSGERRDRDIEEDVSEVNQEPLISIFSQITLEVVKIEKHYCSVVKVGESIEKIYPKNKKEEAINETCNFKNLWDKLKSKSGILKQTLDFEILTSKLLHLLENYTLFVPSSAYKDKPEISLYHHLKSTAAIATCLYDCKIEDKEIENVISEIKKEWQGENLKKKRFVLLGGDISGIQDFIYSITTEHALKGLRGRSFYLQLLSETIARYILDEFNLTPCNILFLGGGNFTLLLPNTSEVKEKIEKITKEIQEKIFKAHKGKLGVIIGYIDLSYEDFKLENFGKVIDRLGEVLAREKRRKFKEILDYKLFEPFGGESKETKGCSICGEEIEENRDKCELCESFEKLSNWIKNVKYIEVIKTSPFKIDREVNSWSRLLEALGYKYWFRENEEEIQSKENLIYLLNDTNFLEKNCSGFKFEALYSSEGTLEDMAEKAGNKEDKENGIKRWAALRMDMDNLGKIFSEGLQNKSISRISMLSYMISLFFSKGIREIMKEKYENCAVIYSGGDDLFILGPWSDLPEVAKDIYDSFREYVCRHPKITLSGGIYIAPSKKFPVYYAAKEAGVAEEEAKKDDKNKITFLDKALEWEKFEEVKKVSSDIVKVLNQGVARSLLTILYAGYQDRELFDQGKISIIRIWRIFYAIKRLIERHKGLESALNNLKDKFVSDFKLIPDLNIAVRWAEFLTRKDQI